MPDRLGPILLLVCLLRARAATIGWESWRAFAWALAGVAASIWWPRWRLMAMAMAATEAPHAGRS